jgi:cell division septation protein DedD
MLRWLVLALLLCNGIYFIWQNYTAPVQGEAQAQAGAPEGARLVMLREGGKDANGVPAATNATSASPAAAQSSSSVVEMPSAPVCHMIGPFKEKISARQVKDRLQALEITVNTYQLNIPGKPDYWVHLGPMRSRKEALDLLRELHSKNIDSFLITEGDLVNGISLGFFTREELAQAVLKQRREQGYEAKIQQVPRFSEELWEVFGDGQYAKFSDELWQQIQSGTQGLELRKNLCDAIASAEKLD